jgi:hypothetical protein
MQKINPTTKRYLALFTIATLAIISVGAYSMFYSTPIATTTGTPIVTSPLHVAFVTSSGACQNGDTICLQGVVAKSHNVYTTTGMNETSNRVFCGGQATCPALQPFDYISVGLVNVSQTATDTCIGNSSQAGAGLVKGCGDWLSNGLTQAAGTVAWALPFANGNVSITKTFTCTSCSSTPINATALYNSTTTCETTTAGCVMFAEANFTLATLQTNDQINVTWYIWNQ